MPLPQPHKQRASIQRPLEYPSIATDAGGSTPSHVRHILVCAGCGKAQHPTLVCRGRHVLAPKTHDERRRARAGAGSHSGATRGQLLSNHGNCCYGGTVVLKIMPSGSQLVAGVWVRMLQDF